MLKQYMTGALLILSMAMYSQGALAQNNSNANDSQSSVNNTSNQQASSSNAGVNAVVNSYAPDHTRATVDSQVPLSLGGYAAFSQANCSNSLGVGATTKIFSVVFNAPKPEINCQHIVRSNAFGNEAKLANELHKPLQAEIQRAISVWQACTADLESTEACIRMNQIRYVDPEHPDLKKTMPYPHFEDQAIIMSATGQPTAVVPSQTIPSRPAGWTNRTQVAEQTPTPSSQPIVDNRVRQAQEAVANLTWVKQASGG